MAQQAFTINPFLDENVVNVLIDPSLVEGGATAYLVVFNRVGNSIQFYTAATSGGEGSGAGPQMTAAWETAVAAITMTYAGGSITLKGPNHSDNAFQDPTEPYFWTPDNGADFSDFWVAAAQAPTSVTVTLDDGVGDLPAAVGPTFSINAVPDGDENTTVQLSVTITGGTYDELAYDWLVTGGTLDDGELATPTWTRPTVTADTDYNIDLEITARGRGTLAEDGTEDYVYDDLNARVNNVSLAFTGNASPISWSLGVSQATGMAGVEISSILNLGVIGISPWQGAILLPPELIDGGVVAYFRYLGGSGVSIQMRLAATTTGDPEGEGPRFTAAVEGYVGAFVFV